MAYERELFRTALEIIRGRPDFDAAYKQAVINQLKEQVEQDCTQCIHYNNGRCAEECYSCRHYYGSMYEKRRGHK
jgi:hypothetical protein